MFGRRYCSASEVIRWRLVTADGLAVTIRPLFGSRANLAMERLSSSGLRGSIVISSTPNDGGASAWIAANWPIPEAAEGSRSTAARFSFGAISLSSSSHFPLPRRRRRDQFGKPLGKCCASKVKFLMFASTITDGN
jgi:hypothetical protein